MAWQPAKPADADKIKDSASDLRDNFAAIEAGDVPHDKVQMEGQGSAPAAVAGSAVVYQLTSDDNIYMKRPDGVQHRLGPSPISAYGEITDANAGSTSSNASPSIAKALNLTVAGGGATGVYNFTITNALDNANYFPIITRMKDTGSNASQFQPAISAVTTSSFTLTLTAHTTARNFNFNIMLVGGY